ncbi:MAG: hypothetical protein JNJ50_10200 [Acidobacteria bacterium]|nr:hypothetical protein [Acidobacteriota bacterium]
MSIIKKLLLVAALVTFVAAQSPEPPLSDSRLTVHTLVREDIFAGFLANNMERFTRGEKNIDLLLEKRPAEKSSLLAWKGGAKIYRAVLAHEANKSAEFKQLYQEALDLFAQGRQANPRDGGVAAVTGGSYAIFADRLPKDVRAAAWATAYDSFQTLWKVQGASIDKMPVHIRGELLAGLTMSAQRTGRDAEATQFLDKMLELMGGTPYEATAKAWKKDPASAATTTLACMNCHESGRLVARLKTLDAK